MCFFFTYTDWENKVHWEAASRLENHNVKKTQRKSGNWNQFLLGDNVNKPLHLWNNAKEFGYININGRDNDKMDYDIKSFEEDFILAARAEIHIQTSQQEPISLLDTQVHTVYCWDLEGVNIGSSVSLCDLRLGSQRCLCVTSGKYSSNFSHPILTIL